jgi:hypothetical protein
MGNVGVSARHATDAATHSNEGMHRVPVVRAGRSQSTVGATAHTRFVPVKLSAMECVVARTRQIVSRIAVRRSCFSRDRKHGAHCNSPWSVANCDAFRSLQLCYGLPLSVVSLMLLPVSVSAP